MEVIEETLVLSEVEIVVIVSNSGNSWGIFGVFWTGDVLGN